MNGENAATRANLIVTAVGPDFLNVGRGPVSVLTWRSHRLRRRVRSTFAAESMAKPRAAETYRACIAELRNSHFDLWKWPDEVAKIPLTVLINCKSMYDHLHKQGSSRADDKRDAFAVQIISDLQETSGLHVRWVATAQGWWMP